MASGNENVILCERGIRTFETYTRNTLDLQSVPVLREADTPPGYHRSEPCWRKMVARRFYGKSMLLQPVLDGLMIEVHNNPEAALCDGAQSLKPEKYSEPA